MKNSLYLILCIIPTSATSQVIQNKAFVIDERYYVPQAENKFGSICIGSTNTSFLTGADCRELPLGLLDISNNKVRYTIKDGELVSASFIDGRNGYNSGPTITAQNPLVLKDNNNAEVQEFAETHKGNYHSIFDETIIDGSPIKNAVFKNDFQELIFDFAVAKDGSLYCFIVLRPGVGRATYMLEAWKLLDSSKEIIKWAKEPKSTDWSKLQSKAELVASTPITEKIEEMAAFSLGDRLIVFDSGSGSFYQLEGSKLQSIHTDPELGKSYLSSILVIDKDIEKAFLLPKFTLKEERKPFKEILEQYGKELPILN